MTPTQTERKALARLLDLAREEDLGPGDVTSSLLPRGASVRGRFVTRQELVLCGGVFLADIARAYAATIQSRAEAEDGEAVASGTCVAEWAGPASAVLPAERVALNFLQRLSGIATLTRQYVEAVAGTQAAIYDTRKTAPGWRALEKYAVRAGGGENHRMGLHDAVLVKDNHLAILGGKIDGDGLGKALESVRGRLPEGGFIEVEVDTLDQLAAVLELPVDVILLDNMTVEELRQAVTMRDEAAGGRSVVLEASGGITLDNVRRVAETGVERIAVGALTHSAVAVDIGMDIDTA